MASLHMAKRGDYLVIVSLLVHKYKQTITKYKFKIRKQVYINFRSITSNFSSQFANESLVPNVIRLEFNFVISNLVLGCRQRAVVCRGGDLRCRRLLLVQTDTVCENTSVCTKSSLLYSQKVPCFMNMNWNANRLFWLNTSYIDRIE